jgi:hypothetical protein
VIQSIQIFRSGIKIGKKQLTVLAHADDVLIGKNEIITIRRILVEVKNVV